MSRTTPPALAFDPQTPALFGWAAPSPPGGAISFESPQDPLAQAARWSLDLPAEAGAAEEALRRNEQALAACRLALEALPRRLGALAGQARPGQAMTFAAAAMDGLPPADAELLQTLAEIELSAAADSYAPTGRAAEMRRAASQQFEQLAMTLQQTLLHLAWVETRLAGQRLGWTVIDWLGDTRTAWNEAALPEQRGLHCRALALALQARLALLSAVTAALQGAIQVSALLSAPGGQLLALPAVWKYINQVLAEASRYRQLSELNEAGG